MARCTNKGETTLCVCGLYLTIIRRRRSECLTIRPVARKGYGSIAHEAKPNGLLTRGP